MTLRLEYLNRQVVCNHCKHQFLSRSRVKIPASAPPELIRMITDVNRAQGFLPSGSGTSDSIPEMPPVALTGSQEFPRLELAGTEKPPVLPADGRIPSSSGMPVASGPSLDPGTERPAPVEKPEPKDDTTSRELEDLRAELDQLLAQIESSRRQADASARVEAELRSARAECDQLRLTVKLHKADLAKRASDIDRLQARLAEAERGLAQANQALSARDDELRGLREQIEVDRRQAAQSLAEAMQARAARDDELRGLREQGELARREAEEHRSEAGRLAIERDQALEEQAGARRREHQLREDLARQTREREAEREAHRQGLEASRLEGEERLHAAEATRAAETAVAVGSLRNEVEDHRQRVDRLRQERDAALRLVEDFYQEQRRLADRAAELETENDRLEDEKHAAVAAAGELRAALDERERADSLLAANPAGPRIDAERLAEERDHAAKQLGDALAQLAEALGQLDQARRQLEAERQAMQSEVESCRSHAESAIKARTEANLRDEQQRFQAETERIGRELENACRERETESRRNGELTERLRLLEAELAEQRKLREAETQAHGMALEELQLMLKSRQRHGPMGVALALESPPACLEVQPAPGDPARLAPALVDVAEQHDAPTHEGQAEPARSAPGPEENPPSAATPLDVAFGPNAADSPDERIAALRVYLRKIQEAEEERMNNRLLSRLTRAWRGSDAR